MPRTASKSSRRSVDTRGAPVPVSGRERWRYRFDNWMSRGTVAIMTLLGLATLVFVGAVALIVVLVSAYPENSERTGFWEVVWGNLDADARPRHDGRRRRVGLQSADAASHHRRTDHRRKPDRDCLGSVQRQDLGLAAGSQPGYRDRPHAHPRVEHQLFTILNELCVANESNRRSTIVVISDHDKIDMEERIRARVPASGSTSIICRCADPLSQGDLHIGSPTTARSIVVLPGDDAPHPDATVIKTALALSNLLHEDEGPQ